MEKWHFGKSQHRARSIIWDCVIVMERLQPIDFLFQFSFLLICLQILFYVHVFQDLE